MIGLPKVAGSRQNHGRGFAALLLLDLWLIASTQGCGAPGTAESLVTIPFVYTEKGEVAVQPRFTTVYPNRPAEPERLGTEEELAALARSTAASEGWEGDFQGALVVAAGTPAEVRTVVFPFTAENLRICGVPLASVDWIVFAQRR